MVDNKILTLRAGSNRHPQSRKESYMKYET